MKRVICALALGSSLVYAAPDAQAQDEPLSWAEIHATLDPHGTWVEVAEYGEAWRPTGVRTSWQPYSEGHWERDGEEWLWVSDFDWGWLPFHYGRWYSHANFGWVWIPGFDYAPSWTVWRDADDYSAWAPLPPGPCWQGTTFVGVVPAGGWVYTPRAAFRSRIVYFRPLYRRPQVRYVHRAYGPYVRPRAYRAHRVGPRHVRPPRRGVHYRRGHVVTRRNLRGPRRVHRPDPSPGRRVHGGRERPGRYRRGAAHPPRQVRRGSGRSVRPVRAPARRTRTIIRRSAPSRRPPTVRRPTPRVRRATPSPRTHEPAPTRGTRRVRKARGVQRRTTFRTSARRGTVRAKSVRTRSVRTRRSR